MPPRAAASLSRYRTHRLQLVQHAREILRRQRQARGDGGRADRQRNRDRFTTDAVFGLPVAQQVADHALQSGVQRIGFDFVHEAVQAA